MVLSKVRLLIITASNLRTTSDCSPETIVNILESIDKNRYLVDILLIDELVPEDMRISESELLSLPMYVPFGEVFSHPCVKQVLAMENVSLKQLQVGYDFAVVVVYNDFGEDGKLLGLLDLVGLPYLSPSLKVSAVCFDKGYTKSLLTSAGVGNAKGFVVHKEAYVEADVDKRILKELEYPVVVKPVSSGNSWGVSVVQNKSGLELALSSAIRYSNEVLIEKYIAGQEFTVGVIGNYLSPKSLSPVMIKHSEDLFDYKSKYTNGKSEEICPAPVTDSVIKILQKAAVDAYCAVKADSHARIDMIFGNDGNVYVLDINTFPGLNRASLFPKELAVEGLTLGQFIDIQVQAKT